MQTNMEGILKDLVRIDNIASDINEKRHLELANIEDKYMTEIENLDRQLEEEKSAAKEYLEQEAAKSEEEVKEIEGNKDASIKALEVKYCMVREEILSQVIHKLFSMEMD